MASEEMEAQTSQNEQHNISSSSSDIEMPDAARDQAYSNFVRFIVRPENRHLLEQDPDQSEDSDDDNEPDNATESDDSDRSSDYDDGYGEYREAYDDGYMDPYDERELAAIRQIDQTNKGLNTIKINTVLLEAIATNFPTRALSQRLQDQGVSEMDAMSKDELTELVFDLTTHHTSSDFDCLLSKSIGSETHVDFDLGNAKMQHLTQHQVHGSEGSINHKSPLVVNEDCAHQWPQPGAKPFFNPYSGKLDKQEIRRGVLASFDLRTKRVLELEKRYYPTTQYEEAIEKVRKLKMDNETTEGGVGTDDDLIAQTYNFIRLDHSCGLALVADQIDTNHYERFLPDWRSEIIHSACFESAILARTLDLAMKYCRDNNERIIIYVTDPWIKCVVVSLLVTADFDVGTIRSSDNVHDRDLVAAHWNDSLSGLQVLVTDTDAETLSTISNGNCSHGLLLDWSIKPARVLNVMNHMARPDQRPTLHKLTVPNDYLQEIEMNFCINWAKELYTAIKFPDWMTDTMREIRIYEFIKSTLHQEHNRYSWVLKSESGWPFSPDIYRCRQGHIFSVMAKMMLNFPEDKEFWVENDIHLVAMSVVLYNDFAVTRGIGDKLSCSTPEELRECFFPSIRTALTTALRRRSEDPGDSTRDDWKRLLAQDTRLNNRFCYDDDSGDERI
ncbi:hypothetical protein FBULB1_14100 [Fusarium bulbicola]|nr:hypothetical protein FBULB1_14100 [Fusarium bulbicola]